MKRRHAITILGAAVLASCRRRDPLQTFSSIAFGTEVHFQTHGIPASLFTEVSAKCSSRLREIESIFSLYDPQSAISRLNRDGKIYSPPEEMARLINVALCMGNETLGLFDITVQPLWNWRQKWKECTLDERQKLEGIAWNDALSLVDFRKVSVTRHHVIFEKPGMAITLNGIVQGYATDEIVSILEKHGIANALVNIGEYATIGNAPDGKPWKVKLSATGLDSALPSGRALSVSAGSGHTFDPAGRFHHIFRPSDGGNPRPKSTIVVTAPSATVADALSTTFAVACEADRKIILAKFPAADFREING